VDEGTAAARQGREPDAADLRRPRALAAKGAGVDCGPDARPRHSDAEGRRRAGRAPRGLAGDRHLRARVAVVLVAASRNSTAPRAPRTGESITPRTRQPLSAN